MKTWIVLLGVVIFSLGCLWFYSPRIMGLSPGVSFHLFAYPTPSTGPWSYYIVSHDSRVTNGPYSEFFKANVYSGSAIWAIISQITVTQSAYILHWGILRKPYWSDAENIDEIYDCQPYELWVKIPGKGGSRTLRAGDMQATLTISSPDYSKQGLVTITWGPVSSGSSSGSGGRPTFIGGIVFMLIGIAVMVGGVFYG